MKIIDLLNKIANGEEVPKKIRFDSTKWHRIIGEKNVYYTSDYGNDLFIYFFRKNLTYTLNDEVEILDDEEKGLPEKLEHLNANYLNDENSYTKEELVLDIKALQNWINKLIDYLEKQRKGE